ncbi:unnamed protein product [Paramecium octaurelia]|uniref:Uncharacterized protein n=1 Tax=Paramecium octaurelia TaxID=43137 RepID=A0A8S1UXH4_PAROT|nr:unnamed protein product [Paramecium octaurelia]
MDVIVKINDLLYLSLKQFIVRNEIEQFQCTYQKNQSQLLNPKLFLQSMIDVSTANHFCLISKESTSYVTIHRSPKFFRSHCLNRSELDSSFETRSRFQQQKLSIWLFVFRQQVQRKQLQDMKQLLKQHKWMLSIENYFQCQSSHYQFNQLDSQPIGNKQDSLEQSNFLTCLTDQNWMNKIPQPLQFYEITMAIDLPRNLLYNNKISFNRRYQKRCEEYKFGILLNLLRFLDQ